MPLKLNIRKFLFPNFCVEDFSRVLIEKPFHLHFHLQLPFIIMFFSIVTGQAFDHFETARVSYAEILARWGMFKKSAEVLKFCPSQQPDPFSLLIACSTCQQVFESDDVADVCPDCKKELIICVICDFPCNGLIMTCPLCVSFYYY